MGGKKPMVTNSFRRIALAQGLLPAAPASEPPQAAEPGDDGPEPAREAPPHG